jgi:ribosomal protein S18 acetylase RimI-like enzyme
MALRVGAPRYGASEGAFGSVTLSRLDWDTNHFGRKMGALALAADAARSANVIAQDLRRAIVAAADDGFEHLILRAASEDLIVARAAEACGMRLVDVALDLRSALPGRRPTALGDATVRPATPDDLEALRSIAGDAFAFGRFGADPFFSAAEVAGFYRQWITNLCNGLAKVVLVAHASDEVAGFISCAVEPSGNGRIPLIATSEDHRRQGVGGALLSASLRWFETAGVRAVRVKTQAANYAALALYTRNGFIVASAELTFSITVPGGPA